ncbi:unnamed protein product [Somion occarium]|uniref:Uncharacterized protein n=1 Tax=Somion occarium TaxID=3059160 RepID=A0ABP1DSX5_9APHY
MNLCLPYSSGHSLKINNGAYWPGHVGQNAAAVVMKVVTTKTKFKYWFIEGMSECADYDLGGGRLLMPKGGLVEPKLVKVPMSYSLYIVRFTSQCMRGRRVTSRCGCRIFGSYTEDSRLISKVSSICQKTLSCSSQAQLSYGKMWIRNQLCHGWIFFATSIPTLRPFKESVCSLRAKCDRNVFVVSPIVHASWQSNAHAS